MPRWLRIMLVVGCMLVIGGAAALTYRYVTRPVTLTVAAGSVDGEAPRMATAIASRLASTGSRVQLKVVAKSSGLEAARAFSAGEVDLAVIRGDLVDSSTARAVVIIAYAVVLIMVPPGSSIESMEELKSTTVAVIGGEVNHRLVGLLDKEYDLARAKVRFKDVAMTDVAGVLQSKQAGALLMVMPVTEHYLAVVRGLFPRKAKSDLGLIPIESAEAIAAVARQYESYELPKGTLRGSPPIPDEDLTTLRVPYYLVAKAKLNDDRIADLTKALMEIRRDLSTEHPVLAQMSAPSTDKDATIPIHPGAAAYFDGEQQSFFDKYGDQLYFGSMLLGALATLMAGTWKFMRTGSGPPTSALTSLYDLTDNIRQARKESDLTSIEDEIDKILKAELTRRANGGSEGADTAALSLAAHRLEHLIEQRRNQLKTEHRAVAAE